jgi:hypothetical protein
VQHRHLLVYGHRRIYTLSIGALSSPNDSGGMLESDIKQHIPRIAFFSIIFVSQLEIARQRDRRCSAPGYACFYARSVLGEEIVDIGVQTM